LGARQGDNAETALIELVDFNDIYGKGKEVAKEPAKKTRRGRTAGKKATGKKEEQAAETTTEGATTAEAAE
jgi:large subunit ribosomal protein L17